MNGNHSTYAFDRAHSNSRKVADRMRQWFDSEHVCVFTIGKTASSAIIGGLEAANVPAFQVHSLTSSTQTPLFVDKQDARPVKELLHKAKIACWLGTRSLRDKRFITTFRDPFDRNLSAFFEQAWKVDPHIDDRSLSEVIRLYDERGAHDATRLWFGRNITAPVGIRASEVDLVTSPTKVVVRPHIRFLFMKHDARAEWEAAVSSFVGRQIEIGRRNASTNKAYRDRIAEMRQHWRPSREIIERTIDPDLWSAIYDEAEKETIRAKWNISRTLAP